MATCSIDTLLTNACSNGFKQAAQNEIMFRAILLQLACNIVNGGGGGGGGGLTCGNYSGGEPSFTPDTGCGLALDTSNDAFWAYRSGAWTELIVGL